MPRLYRYYITSLIVTGEPTSPQTVYYKNLSDINGIKMPLQFSSPPLIKIFGCTRPQDFYLPEITTTYFKISRFRAGVIDITTPLTVSLEIIATGITAQILGMSTTDMVAMMKIYLGQETLFVKVPKIPIPQILFLLNNAQDELIEKLITRPQLNRELDTELLNQVLDEDGAIDLSALDTKVYMDANGIKAVKYVESGKYCDLISEEEFKSYKNRTHVYDAIHPVYRVFGSKIYPLPFDDTEVVSEDIEADVDYYVGEYTTLTYNGVGYVNGDIFTGVSGVTTYSTTGTGKVIKAQYVDLLFTKKIARMTLTDSEVNNVNCELNERKQKILIGMALADYIDFTSQALRCWQNAERELEKLLETYPATDTHKRSGLDRNTDDYYDENEGLPVEERLQQYIP